MTVLFRTNNSHSAEMAFDNYEPYKVEGQEENEGWLRGEDLSL